MKMRHISGGRQIDVAPDMADTYASEGWVRVPVTPAKKAATKRKQAAAAPSSSDATNTGTTAP